MHVQATVPPQHTGSDGAAAPRRAIAVVCFLPDTGHVSLLLRVALLAGQHLNGRVVCFLPSPFEKAATDLGFEFHEIAGLDQRSGEAVFAALSKKSVFYCAFSNDQDLLDHYWAELHEAAGHGLAALVARLDVLQPVLMLTDGHRFRETYAHLAVHCGAKHVILAAGGTPLFRVRRFVRVYGWSNAPGWWQSLVEIAGGVSEHALAIGRRLRSPARRQLTALRLELLRNKTRELLGPATPPRERPLVVTAGVSTIERQVLVTEPPDTSARVVRLAPVIDLSVQALPADLKAWMAAQPEGRMVYVSFGTMVRPHADLLRAVLRGLLAAQVSILWAQPRAQREWMKAEPQPDRLRCEDFAPQSALLLSGRVDCFVTHAGAGSVQEALMAGVPMFCVPFIWDHPYLASVVEKLGVGVNRSRATLTWRKVRDGVRAILEEPGYRGRARQIALELRSLQSAQSQTTWIDELMEGAYRAG